MTLREAHAESCRRRGWSQEKIALRQKLADSMISSREIDREIAPGREEEAILWM